MTNKQTDIVGVRFIWWKVSLAIWQKMQIDKYVAWRIGQGLPKHFYSAFLKIDSKFCFVIEEKLPKYHQMYHLNGIREAFDKWTNRQTHKLTV